MARLPDLRDQLVAAARRQDSRRIRRPGWRGFALGTIAAATLSGAAIAAIGSQDSPGIDGRPLVPKDPAAARRLARERQITDLTNRANFQIYDEQPRCDPRQSGPSSDGLIDAPTPRGFTRQIAAFRRPATAVDRRALREPTARPGFGMIYRDGVRVLRAGSGEPLVAVVFRRDGPFLSPAGCLRDQQRRFRMLTESLTPDLRAEARRSYANYRTGQEGNRKIPAIRAAIGFAGGGAASPQDLAAGRTAGAGGVRGQPTRYTALIPDGVSQVEVRFPAEASRGPNVKPRRYSSAYVRRARVIDNTVAFNVPRSPEDAVVTPILFDENNQRISG